MMGRAAAIEGRPVGDVELRQDGEPMASSRLRVGMDFRQRLTPGTSPVPVARGR
ncbi:hypothetical protein ACTWPT_55355 [Nonomuraea sp. 3N208]|uniref:hypothetical protein n=1 Tax=Nonomuraea sp. 3N208 TaxID=3457421 RepID=UPI003FD4FB5A